MSTGKFHGEIAATTPTGCWTTSTFFEVTMSMVEGSTWPRWRRTSSAARRKCSAVPPSISERAEATVLPTSAAIISLISSTRSRQIRWARAAELGAFEHRGAPPRLERPRGLGNRRVHLALGRGGDRADLLAGGGVGDRDPLAVSLGPGTADVGVPP